MVAWIIFDADNMLWVIEHPYDDARSELVEYISNQCHLELGVDEYQRERNARRVRSCFVRFNAKGNTCLSPL
jgi:hypothetical protein